MNCSLSQMPLALFRDRSSHFSLWNWNSSSSLNPALVRFGIVMDLSSSCIPDSANEDRNFRTICTNGWFRTFPYLFKSPFPTFWSIMCIMPTWENWLFRNFQDIDATGGCWMMLHTPEHALDCIWTDWQHWNWAMWKRDVEIKTGFSW